MTDNFKTYLEKTYDEPFSKNHSIREKEELFKRWVLQQKKCTNCNKAFSTNERPLDWYPNALCKKCFMEISLNDLEKMRPLTDEEKQKAQHEKLVEELERFKSVLSNKAEETKP